MQALASELYLFSPPVTSAPVGHRREPAMILRSSRIVAFVVTLLMPIPAWAASRDAYLPDGTEFVVTFNIRKLLDSPQVQPELTKLRSEIKNAPDAQNELDALGFDPLPDLDSITAAGVPSR